MDFFLISTFPPPPKFDHRSAHALCNETYIGGLVAPGGLPGSTACMARQPVAPSSPACVRPGGPNGMAVPTRSAAEVFTPSREEIISFGGINESAVVGLQSSGWMCAQPNADASQLEPCDDDRATTS
jgi:hypothetical protein